MEGLTQEQIIEAITANPEIGVAVTEHVITTEKGKEIIGNKAEAIYKNKIGDEVSRIHSQYDNDAFEILGEKPSSNPDGGKVKTYDFIKDKLSELKTLREQKDSLTKDAEVQRLNSEIERLKKEGGGAHWEQTFNTAKGEWETKENQYKQQLEDLNKGIYTSSVENSINTAKAGLKFNPDVPQSAIDALYGSVKSALIANSKKEGDNIVYLKPDGSAILNKEYKPASAEEILKERMNDVLLKSNDNPGGGAQDTIAGSIKTTKVEGKDDQKSLVLDTTKFKTRVEFMKVVSETLKAEGIAKSNPAYQQLADKAAVEYKVSELPRS